MAAESVVVQARDGGSWTTWRRIRELADAAAADRVYSLDPRRGG